MAVYIKSLSVAALIFLLNGLSLVTAQTCLPAWTPTSVEEQVAWNQEKAEWEHYLGFIPRYLEQLPSQPDAALIMPVEGVKVSEVRDTWGAPRGQGRVHEGQDIFAAVGTPVYSATPGFIWRISDRWLGGKTVTVLGAGAMRYYYAHLANYAPGLREGLEVTTDTLLGSVGKTGNARFTAPHLHLGVSTGDPLQCEREVFDPLPILVDR